MDLWWGHTLHPPCRGVWVQAGHSWVPGGAWSGQIHVSSTLMSGSACNPPLAGFTQLRGEWSLQAAPRLGSPESHRPLFTQRDDALQPMLVLMHWDPQEMGFPLELLALRLLS